MKGKPEKISTDEQLAVMYEKHKKKKHIFLWLKCILKSKKRASTQGDAPQSKRHVSFLNMMSEVDIVGKRKEKHGEKYTPVQLNCWAHMINTHKHESLDSPPKKSFLGKKRSGDTPGVSPGKRITLRSECIDQLDKWHSLKERGVIYIQGRIQRPSENYSYRYQKVLNSEHLYQMWNKLRTITSYIHTPACNIITV